jgi:hypothetical protein
MNAPIPSLSSLSLLPPATLPLTGGELMLLSQQSATSGKFNSVQITSNNFVAALPALSIATLLGAMFKIKQVNQASSTYTVLSSDFHIGFNNSFAGVVNVLLPFSMSQTTPVIIRDITGNFNTNNFLIVPSGLDRIDGQANVLMTSNYGSIWLFPNPVGGWVSSWF